MNKQVISLVTVGLIVSIAGPLALGSGGDTKSQITELMGENFVQVQIILADLMRSNYKDIPQRTAVIREHALELEKKPPPFVVERGGEDLFLSYANHLKVSSSNLIQVLETLNKHSLQKDPNMELPVDYLRVVAAEHFGQMITRCVLCHNQFRRKVIAQ